ncbi:MAG: hypothetical protein OXF74_08520 [Rhodobacteraceae bacterium]|nr:hypothetical protein [Paracoccaceae bacterium]
MTAIIYQYWKGNFPDKGYAHFSRQLFTEYARRNQIEYRFDENPTFFRGKYSEWFTRLRPLYDKWFHQFEYVLYADMDIFPTQSASAGLFDTPIGHFAMAEEKDSLLWRTPTSKIGGITNARDRRWVNLCRLAYGVEVPTYPNGLPRVFNAGLVLYSNEGMKVCPELFPNRHLYSFINRVAGLPSFYRRDQNYLGLASSIEGIHFSELSNCWNQQVRSTDSGYAYTETDEAAQFIHLQTRDRSSLTDAEIMAVITGE